MRKAKSINTKAAAVLLPGTRVRPLKWKRSLWDPDRPDRPQFHASFGGIEFHVIRNDNGLWGYDGNNRFGSEADAKAAAQAALERHVLGIVAQVFEPGESAIQVFAQAVQDWIDRNVRGSLEVTTTGRLSRLLVSSVEEQDPVAVAAFASLIHARGERISNDRERYADMKREERDKADAKARNEGRDPEAERAAASIEAKRRIEEIYGSGKRKEGR